ncbi:MAG: tail fiber domain-containing protein [Gammaproteobacteria bacterium]|nr:tail fiber domain-containing protein [Gammaproteobacteria bacterium]
MQRKTWSKLTVFSVLVLAMGFTANAQVPDEISYQGYLTDSAGQPQIDPLVVEFAIYAVDSGGTPLWSEFQDVFPAQGLFSTRFGGATNPFPVGMFDTPLFLGVKVSTDPEMTPRIPITAAAYSHKAKDSDTVGGFSATQLDQTADVASLSSQISTTDGNLSLIQVDVSTLQSSISSIQSDVSQNQSDIGTNQSDIGQLQVDLNATDADVTAVTNSLSDYQGLISQSCSSGSSIRQVFPNGTVSCEFDDEGPWDFDGDIYALGGTRVGLGTTAPAAMIQIDSPVDVDPFRARVASLTKLRVHANGSVSVGTSSAGPDNGLYVSGQAGIGTSIPAARLTAADDNWQFQLDNNSAGGDDWFFGSSATAWASGAGKFIISPSASSTNAALAIDSNKDVGIGTTDPDTRLHINGGSDVTATGGGFLTVGSSTGSNIAIDNNEIMGRNSAGAGTLALNAEGGQVTVNSGGSRDNDSLRIRGRVYFDNGGNSGMEITATNSNPTNAVLVPSAYEEALVGQSTAPFWRVYSREFYASSPIEYKTYSDRSVKKNISPISGALATIQALNGVKYELINHPMNTSKREMTAEQQFVNDNQLGFVAQDVAEVLPQLVSEDEDSGLKTVGYMGLIPVLVEALKEQQRQIDEQRAQLDAQSAEFKALLKRLN